MVDERGCLNWTGARFKTGYPKISWKGKTHYGHRLSYHLNIGEIPVGKFVCHSCDNPKCCNPAHYFLGTQKDNMRDASQKGRLAGNGGKIFGSNHHLASLTESQVVEIRARYVAEGESQRALARAFGVSQRCIANVVGHKTWRHVA